jgi:hypothetical protein
MSSEQMREQTVPMVNLQPEAKQAKVLEQKLVSSDDVGIETPGGQHGRAAVDSFDV